MGRARSWLAIAIVCIGCRSRPPHDLIWPFDGDPTVGYPPPKKPPETLPAAPDRLDEAFATHRVIEEGRKLLEKACGAIGPAATQCLDTHEAAVRFNISTARSILHAKDDATPVAERQFKAWETFHTALAEVRELCATELLPESERFYLSALSTPLRLALNDYFAVPKYPVSPLTTYEIDLLRPKLQTLSLETGRECAERAMEPRRGKWVALFKEKT